MISMEQNHDSPSMLPQHTTAMDGGSVDNAGAIIDQYILYIKKKASGGNLWPFYMNQICCIKPYDSPAHRQ